MSKPSTAPAWAAIQDAIAEARKVAAALDRGPGGREVALAITKLEEANLWLGQAAAVIDAKEGR